jgi:hypothetical protein
MKIRPFVKQIKEMLRDESQWAAQPHGSHIIFVKMVEQCKVSVVSPYVLSSSEQRCLLEIEQTSIILNKKEEKLLSETIAKLRNRQRKAKQRAAIAAFSAALGKTPQDSCGCTTR